MNKILFYFLMLFFMYPYCFAVDVLYTHFYGEELADKMLIELACKYYGLNIKPLILAKHKEWESLFHSLDYNAIIISAGSLKVQDMKKLLSILKNKQGNHVSLLIIGVTSDIDSKLLNNLSGGTIENCLNNNILIGIFKISNIRDITQQLSKLKIPFIGKNINYFIYDRSC